MRKIYVLSKQCKLKKIKTLYSFLLISKQCFLHPQIEELKDLEGQEDDQPTY